MAFDSWTPALTEGEYTLYLEPYNDAPNHPWKLLGGSVEGGVSIWDSLPGQPHDDSP